MKIAPFHFSVLQFSEIPAWNFLKNIVKFQSWNLHAQDS